MASAFARPVIIDSVGGCRELQAIGRGIGEEHRFAERWLQDALFQCPQALPIAEIDPHMGSLTAICTELETGAGPADILYVTPTGQLVLVETKLWRNPEARRAVVGQILDYARRLASWTYEELDRASAVAAKRPGGHLWRCVQAKYPDTDEATFINGVSRGLHKGDFLLLIVGDGIHDSAQSLVTFLEQYGHLRFGLALVEVAAFKLPDGQTLIQPRILTKTQIVQRTLLIGPHGPVSLQQAALAEDAAAPVNSGVRERFAGFWRQFLEALRAIDPVLAQREPAKGSNQFFAMPPSGSLAWVSSFLAQGSGRAGAYLTFGREYADAEAVYEDLLNDRQAIEREIGATLDWDRSQEKIFIHTPTVSFTNLDDPTERARVAVGLATVTAHLIRAMEPRLRALANSRQ